MLTFTWGHLSLGTPEVKFNSSCHEVRSETRKRTPHRPISPTWNLEVNRAKLLREQSWLDLIQTSRRPLWRNCLLWASHPRPVHPRICRRMEINKLPLSSNGSARCHFLVSTLSLYHVLKAGACSDQTPIGNETSTFIRSTQVPKVLRSRSQSNPSNSATRLNRPLSFWDAGALGRGYLYNKYCRDFFTVLIIQYLIARTVKRIWWGVALSVK